MSSARCPIWFIRFMNNGLAVTRFYLNILRVNTHSKDPEPMSGYFLLIFQDPLPYFQYQKLLCPKPCPLQSYSSYLTFLLGHLVAAAHTAVVRRQCWLACVFFTANSCHVPSRFAQFSPPIHCPSRGYMQYVRMHACAPYVRRWADGGQLLHTTYIHSFSPALHANSRFLSGPGLPEYMSTVPHHISADYLTIVKAYSNQGADYTYHLRLSQTKILTFRPPCRSY